MWINSFFYYACCCFYMLTVVTVVIAVGYVVVLAVVVMSWVRVVDCWLVFKVCQSNFKFCLLAPSTEFIQPPSQTRYTRQLLLLKEVCLLCFITFAVLNINSLLELTWKSTEHFITYTLNSYNLNFRSKTKKTLIVEN